jgi:hypothetical protein
VKLLKRILCRLNAHYVPKEQHRWNGVFWQAECPTCKKEVWYDESSGWQEAPHGKG